MTYRQIMAVAFLCFVITIVLAFLHLFIAGKIVVAFGWGLLIGSSLRRP